MRRMKRGGDLLREKHTVDHNHDMYETSSTGVVCGSIAPSQKCVCESLVIHGVASR